MSEERNQQGLGGVIIVEIPDGSQDDGDEDEDDVGQVEVAVAIPQSDLQTTP
jgi:hypothetical protein